MVTKIQFILGVLFLLLGFIGLLLPIMPTTPFVLVALYFFDKSSPKFHSWCLKIPGVGKSIEDWQKHKVIRKKAKVQSALLLVTSAAIMGFNPIIPLWLKSVAILTIVLVLIFILTRSSHEKDHL